MGCSDQMKLSIVMPVYNEGKMVRRALGRVLRAELPSGVGREVIVVDDGSTDNSRLEVKKAMVRDGNRSLKLLEREHKGKGAAVREGIMTAKGDVILIQDADLEYNPKYYSVLLEPLLAGKSKVVYGSRLSSLRFSLWGRNATVFPSHYLGNKLLSLFTGWLFGVVVTDIETGYKVFFREVIDGVSLVSDGFEIEPELTAKILKRGFTIYEVPIKIKPRGYTDGKKIHWWHGVRALWILIKSRARWM